MLLYCLNDIVLHRGDAELTVRVGVDKYTM